MKNLPALEWIMISHLFFLISSVQAASVFTRPTVIPEVELHSRQSSLAGQEETVQTTHITRKEVETSPVIDLSELLMREQSIVRVTANSMDSSQTALSIRGFGDNAATNSLILVDGFPLTNPSLMAPNFNAISLADIEHIDIIQGSQGSLWGDQAVGGVVNIVTRHPEKWVANLYGGLGSFHHVFYNALTGSKFANGLFFKVYGFLNRNDHFRYHNRQNNEVVLIRTGMDYARGSTWLGFQLSDNTTLFPGSLTQAQYDANPRQATSSENFSHYKMQTGQFLNKQELGDDWILETRLSRDVLTGDGFISLPFRRNEWENRFHLRLKGRVKQAKLIAGYEGQNSYYGFVNDLFNERVSALRHNLYAQAKVPVARQVDFTLGTRFAWQKNKAERIIGQPVYSINRVWVAEQGIAWHPAQAWQFFVRRDGNFRLPKANEETWTPTEATGLQPQTGVSYEAGLVHSTDREKTQFNVYQLDLHHEIAFDPTQTPTAPFGSYQNFSMTRRRGVTLAESYQFTKKLLFDMQINYVDARFASGMFVGKHIPAVPAWNANADLQYAVTEDWRVRLSALYTGSRYASLDVNNTGRKQSGYWLDSAAIQYGRNAYEISFEAVNLFGVRYTVYTLYDKTSQSYLYYPGEGRSYLLTIKVNID